MYFNNKDENILSAYSDADWAGDLNDHKSTSRYISMLSGRAVSWKVGNKPVLLILLLKLSMLHWQILHRKSSG